MYTDAMVWAGIILGGIVGCLATAAIANQMKGVPFAAVGGNWKKHLWSIIFMIPVPILLSIGGWVGIIIAFLWLVLAPTIASKAYFGPKDLPAMTLNIFHTGFAIAGLVVYFLVTGAAVM